MLRLKLKVRLKSELTVRTGAGAGSGAGSGAGNGDGSGAGGWIWRLEQELEWQSELDLEAGVGAEAEGTKSSEIPAWDPQIRILGPNEGFLMKMLVFQKDFDEKWPLSKPENVIFARATKPYNPRISLQVYHQKCILRGPYSQNPRRHPPF